MCARNASKNLSWLMRDCTGITSLCSAVQNYHRCTVHVQPFYWPAFLYAFQSFQKWDLRGKGTGYVAMCWAKGRVGSAMACNPTSGLHLADQWLLLFTSSLSLEMVFWGTRGYLTSFCQLDLETIKTFFFPLKLSGICHFRKNTSQLSSQAWILSY